MKRSELKFGFSPCGYAVLGDVFLKNLSLLFVFGGLFIIVFDFFVFKNGRGAGGEFHF